MQLVITLDGLEKPAQINALYAAIGALYGHASLTAPASTAPTLSVPASAAAEVKHGGELSDADALQMAAGLLGGAAPLESAGSPAAAAPSPTAPAVPPATSAPTASVPPSGSLDSRGFPWDERIHSGNRKTNADGTWAKRRGVQKIVTSKVENEYRAQGFGVAGAAPAPAPAAVTPPPSAVTPPPAAAVTPPPPVAAPPAPAADPQAFVNLVNHLGTLLSGGELTQAQVAQAVQAMGLVNLPELQKCPERIPELKTLLGIA